MKEQILIEDKAIIEKQIAKSLESSLDNYDLKDAKINMEFYNEHIKKYGSTNLALYCNLRNRYLRITGCCREDEEDRKVFK